MTSNWSAWTLDERRNTQDSNTLHAFRARLVDGEWEYEQKQITKARGMQPAAYVQWLWEEQVKEDEQAQQPVESIEEPLHPIFEQGSVTTTSKRKKGRKQPSASVAPEPQPLEAARMFDLKHIASNPYGNVPARSSTPIGQSSSSSQYGGALLDPREVGRLGAMTAIPRADKRSKAKPSSWRFRPEAPPLTSEQEHIEDDMTAAYRWARISDMKKRSAGLLNAATLESSRGRLIIGPDLMAMTSEWSAYEGILQRRVVAYQASSDHNTLAVSFAPVQVGRGITEGPLITCILWPARRKHYITITDIGRLLEGILDLVLTTEAMKHVRKTLETFDPISIREASSTRFMYDHIMMLRNPRPVNVEGTTKIILWSDLQEALEKIIGKYCLVFVQASAAIGYPRE